MCIRDRINGSGAAKGPVGRIIRHYHPDADPIRPTEADELRQSGKAMTDEEVAEFNANQKSIADVYRGPRMRIHEITIEGPLEKSWPPESHTALVGETTNPQKVDIEKVLTNFATRAYRRPLPISLTIFPLSKTSSPMANPTKRLSNLDLRRC